LLTQNFRPVPKVFSTSSLHLVIQWVTSKWCVWFLYIFHIRELRNIYTHVANQQMHPDEPHFIRVHLFVGHISVNACNLFYVKSAANVPTHFTFLKSIVLKGINKLPNYWFTVLIVLPHISSRTDFRPLFSYFQNLNIWSNNKCVQKFVFMLSHFQGGTFCEVYGPK